MATETTVFLGEFETKTLLELETRGPGTYLVKLMVRCNSLLSSIYVRTVGAGGTVKCNYFDTTTGDEFTGERFDLTGHDLLGGAFAGETDRVLVTQIHNKPQLEVVVTGAAVEFGVYATAVSTNASDIDSALIRDGDVFVQATHKAIPIACLNEDTGMLEFIRCPLPVNIVSTQPGVPFFIRGKENADPGNTVDIFVETVPAGVTRYLQYLWVTAYNDADFSLLVDGEEVAAGRIVATAHQNVPFHFLPPRPVSAGAEIKLQYLAEPEPNYPCPVTAFLSGNDVTI